MKNILNIKNLILVIQGAIVGTGAILPGISGGVLCVAFGIYEPMMALFSHPKKAFKDYYQMFVPFLIGWILGFILLANVVEKLFTASSSVALMLFFGLICGTLPELIKDSEKSDTKMNWTPFVLSLAISYFVFCMLEKGGIGTISITVWSYVLCGLVWGLSMIIPGLSSSSILIYVGLYESMTAGIAALDFGVIFPLIVGLMITVLSLARIVNLLYEKHYSLISRIVLGIVVASSLQIIPTNFDGPVTFIISIICFIVGFLIVRYMDILRNKQSTK